MKDVRVPEQLQRAMAAEAEAAREARAKVLFLLIMMVVMMMTRLGRPGPRCLSFLREARSEVPIFGLSEKEEKYGLPGSIVAHQKYTCLLLR